MIIEDKDLGQIVLLANARSRRIVVRYREGKFQLTHPKFVSQKELEKAIEEMKPRLIALKEKALPKFIFTENTVFKTLSFDVVIKQNTLSNIYTNLSDGILSITYPPTVDLASEKMQAYIKKVIENVCRAEATKLLPAKVKELAGENSFTVAQIKINKSRSRWGSCSSKKNINLSYFCMMLPKHLVDFIILHELCHTREMNHGEKFWAELDGVTENRAKELTKELKQVKLSW